MTFSNNVKVIPATYLGQAHTFVILGFVFFGADSYLSFIPQKYLGPALAILLFLIILSPIHLAFAQKMSVTAHRLSYRDGIVFPSTTGADLADVTTVQVDEPWNFRLFGLARIAVSLRGTELTPAMEGMDAREAQKLLALLHPPNDSSLPSQLDHADSSEEIKLKTATSGATPTSGRSFKLTLRELAATYFGNLGFVFVTLVSGYQVLSEIWEQTGSGEAIPSSIVTGIVIASVSVLLAVVIGYMTIHNFSMNRDSNNSWTIRYGLIERRNRRISSHGVVGVRLKVATVDALARTSRISIGSKDPMNNEFGKLRFPSLELDRAERVLRSITKKSGLAPQIASTLPWVAVSFALVFGAAGIGTMLWEPQSTRNAVIGALAWLIGFPLILRIITPRIRTYPDSDLVELRHWGYGLTIDYLPLSSISIASYTEIPILKVGLLEISGYTQVRIFAFAFVPRAKANSILSYVKQPK
ncbi:PH domain-containing protein [Dermabacteraceae bacterium P7054]